MKKWIKFIPLILFVVFSYLAAIVVFIPMQTKQLKEFQENAERELGTSDFSIQVEDVVIARTKDGRQYPSQEWVSTYYQNKFKLQVASISIAFILFLALSMFYYQKKEEKHG